MKCVRCNKTEERGAVFSPRKYKPGISSSCDECREHKAKFQATEGYKEYRKEFVEKNRIDLRKRKNTIVQQRRRKVFEYLKEHPCSFCNEDNPIVLEFHHADGDKDLPISTMVSRAMSWETIMREIEKCVVLCANCHRRVTAEERGWYKDWLEEK